jgi:hypothetical protein
MSESFEDYFSNKKCEMQVSAFIDIKGHEEEHRKTLET